jgi:ribonuclease P protein component
MPEVTFGRDKRLLTARAYQAVFGGTCYKVAHPNLLLLARTNQFSHARLGLVVAKKHIRHAVNRNRIKRVVRDTFRHAQGELNALDVVFLVRKGMDTLSSSEQTALLEQSWQRLLRKLQTDQR